MTAHLVLTFDNLGSAAAVGRGEISRPDRNECGLAFGLPRLLNMLAAYDLKATFFIEGWNALHHPDAVLSIAAAGHEVGTHGWVHEQWHRLTKFDTERLLVDATQAMRLIGIQPVAFRAPGGYRGIHTDQLLSDLNYKYDSSIMPGWNNRELEISVLPGGVMNLPWRWDGNDYCQFIGGHPNYPSGPTPLPRVIEYWRDLAARTVERDGLTVLTLHPAVTFIDDDRVRAFEILMDQYMRMPGLQVLSGGACIFARSRRLQL